MKTIHFILTVTCFFAFSGVINAQSHTFKEDFSNVSKWKNAKSITLEKEGDETVAIVQGVEGKEITVMRDFSEFSAGANIKISYNFFVTENLSSLVQFGKTPSRISIIGESGTSKLRLCGEKTSMSFGAKFLSIVPNQWNKIEIIYKAAEKTVQFILNGDASQTVDLSKQESDYDFILNRMLIKAVKGDVIKIKNIEFSE